MAEGRSFLILWQTAEAESWIGATPSSSIGSHAKGLHKGDRMFITACDNKELYLLGAMTVSTVGTERSRPDRGKPFAAGKTLAGPFQMVPLSGLKWRLRFEHTDSPKLSHSKSLLWQVRSRRRLTPVSAELLLGVLAQQRNLQPRIMKQFAREGQQLMQMVSKRERDQRVRRAALQAYDFTCKVCDLRPGDVYGEFAKECLDIHHLRPLGSAKARKTPTTLRDVILVCPTCHRALHMFEAPGAWRRLRKQCRL